MEIPQVSEKYQAIPRWRSTEFMAFSPGSGGLGVIGVGGQECKFVVDESVLADLMDLDPLGEQLDDEETWMGTSPQMSEFALAFSLSGYSPFPPASPANSSQASMLHTGPTGLQSVGSELLETLQQELSTSPVGSCNISQMLLSDPMLEMDEEDEAEEGSPLAAVHVSLQQSCTGEGEEREKLEEKFGGPEEEEEVEEVEEELVQPDGSRTKSRAMMMAKMVPASLTPLSPLRDRLVQAVRFIGRLRVDTLVQTWVPVTINGGNERVLSTRDQPYVLERKNDQLWLFRAVSESFEFPTEEGDGTSVAGLPGRVFARKAAEWSPNVQLFTSLEYPRWKEAQRCDIRASLAVPVLDPISNECVAVIELVGRGEKVHFGPDVDVIIRALQAVNLLTCDPLESPPLEWRSQGRQAALAEIAEVLTAVCETHKLPLAQTWVPGGSCGGTDVKTHNGSKRVRPEIGGNCMSLRTGDGPCYVSDGRMWGFRRACLEHGMKKGHGVPGKAFASNQPIFESDVKNYSKDEYPVCHFAKLFGLAATVAIRLRSIHTGSDDYILEFFLPPHCEDSKEQQLMLNSLSITMQRICRSLRTVTDREVEEEGRMSEDGSREGQRKIIKCEVEEEEGFGPHTPVMNQEGKSSQDDLLLHRPPLRQLSSQQLSELQGGGSLHHHGSKCHPSYHSEHSPVERVLGMDRFGCSIGAQGAANERRRLDRRRGTSEKTIGLNVLQQYFAGSLKDAAKSIGVCPTTLKRICRQHGISRWPSRKINKVNRSLKKLQGVIDSVQGADGALRINALTGDITSGAAVPRDDGTISSPRAGNWSVSWATPPQHDSDAKEQGSHSIVPASREDNLTKQDPCSPDTVLLSVLPTPGAKVDEQLHADEDRNESPSPKCDPRVHNRGAALAALMKESKPSGNANPAGGSAEGCVSVGNHSSEREEERCILSRDSPHFGSSSQHGVSDCSSPTSSGGHGSEKTDSPKKRNVEDTSSITVKVTYGLDTVRFKLSPDASLLDMREEVGRRLKVAGEGFDLKYLDDDEEWMLLACDADLQESIEVMRLSNRHAMKLMVRCNTSAS